MPKQMRTILAGVLLGAVLLGAILYFLRNDWQSGEGKKAVDHESQLYNTPEESEGSSYRGTSYIANMRRLIASQGAPTKDAMVAHYKMYYMYPAESRPLNADMNDLLEPFKLRTSPRPVFPVKEPKEGEKPTHTYQFTGPHRDISGEETFVAMLEAKDQSTDEKVKPEIISAVVQADIQNGQVKIGEAEFNDKGKFADATEADNIVTFSWKPPDRTRLYQGELSLVVTFKLPGTEPIVSRIVFSSTPSPPAIFSGNFDERIQDGSLVVTTELDVKQPGYYVIEANLFQAESGKPVHWTSYHGELGGGRATVDLKFFGKVFHDKDMDGAFIVRHLRGYRNNVPFSSADVAAAIERKQKGLRPISRNEPLHQFLKPFDKEYTTRSYALDQFSTKEYDGDDKRSKMRELGVTEEKSK